ncbi:MAG: hypothetical protein GHCLOJNM_04244 [bacterium]|nr:hypothetical protein [bacterium]
MKPCSPDEGEARQDFELCKATLERSRALDGAAGGFLVFHRCTRPPVPVSPVLHGVPAWDALPGCASPEGGPLEGNPVPALPAPPFQPLSWGDGQSLSRSGSSDRVRVGVPPLWVDGCSSDLRAPEGSGGSDMGASRSARPAASTSPATQCGARGGLHPSHGGSAPCRRKPFALVDEIRIEITLHLVNDDSSIHCSDLEFLQYICLVCSGNHGALRVGETSRADYRPGHDRGVPCVVPDCRVGLHQEPSPVRIIHLKHMVGDERVGDDSLCREGPVGAAGPRGKGDSHPTDQALFPSRGLPGILPGSKSGRASRPHGPR